MRSRIAHKCLALDAVASHMDEAAEGEVIRTQTPEQYIFTEPVPEPCTLTEVSLATKKCISQAFERELIRDALAAAGGNRVKAAALLDISRTVLYEKMEQYQLK